MRRMFILFILAAAVISCSKFAYQVADGDSASVEVVLQDSDASHLYTVMAGRMVNSVHYVWEADTLPRNVSCGEYYVTVFHAEESLYEIEGLEAFGQDVSVSMQDVYATVPCLDENMQERMVSFNPYASFVTPAEGCLLCDFKKVSAVDSTCSVTFSPQSLTQRLNFRLKIHPEEGVVITGIRAAVSGVAGKVRLMSGLVRNDVSNPTFRQYVEMSHVSTSGDVHIYEGSASVLGLFPSSSHEYDSGPGIFQVEVSANVSNYGEEIRRVFYAGINMKNAIEEAKLMEMAGDGSGFRVIRQEALLEVPAVLEVGREQVISGAGEGIQEWFISDADIEVEI